MESTTRRMERSTRDWQLEKQNFEVRGEAGAAIGAQREWVRHAQVNRLQLTETFALMYAQYFGVVIVW